LTGAEVFRGKAPLPIKDDIKNSEVPRMPRDDGTLLPGAIQKQVNGG